MDDKRRNEIAYAFLKFLLKKDGFEIDSNFRRRMGNVASQTGLEFKEVLEFGTTVGIELINEVSDKNKEPTKDELDGHWGHGGH